MKILKRIIVVMIGISVVSAAGLYVIKQQYMPTYSHRFKMTVEIETDGKIYSGDGIVDVDIHSNGPLSGIAQGEAFGRRAKGEAPVVDLGANGVVVALIYPGAIYSMGFRPRPQFADFLALRGYCGENNWPRQWEKCVRAVVQERGQRTLIPEQYPAFVWIKNINDRASAVPIPPGQIASVTGIPATIKGVTVEIVQDAPTGKIYNQIPWLLAQKRAEQEHSLSESHRNYQLNAHQLLGDLTW